MADLVNGLGGSVGFGEYYLSRNDDSYQTGVDLTGVFGSAGLNFFGTQYNYVSINNNGNVTLSNYSYSGLSTYTPFGLANGGYAIIAPFFADVDTRLYTNYSTAPAEAYQITPTPGGNSVGSDLVWYDLDSSGYGKLTVTWDDVGYYYTNTDKLNAFQLQLIGKGAGNFDIVYRYEAVNWTTGDASSGVEGLGGTVARAGYSTGDGSAWYELGHSGSQNDMLALASTAGNTGVAGYYQFSVNNGTALADNLVGTDGNDIISGLEGNDVIVGGNGDDYLAGNGGADQMIGGPGNDTYVTDGLDTIAEDYGNGTDTVISNVSYVLGNNIENLRLSGVSSINGTGNSLDNTFTGNSGNNTFSGGSGSDAVDYSISQSSISVDLSSSLAQYINYYEGTDILLGIENLIGSIYSDELRGNSSDNTFLPGLGSDTIDGGAGVDTVVYVGTSSSLYTVTRESGSLLSVSDGNGHIDTLSNVERLQFANAGYAFDSDGRAGEVAKILAAVFGAGSITNAVYAGIGLDLMDSGMSYENLASLAINAAGANTPQAIVNLLWTNLMGAAPSAEQAQPFINMLNSGLTVGALGVMAADYAETISIVPIGNISEYGLAYVNP